MEHRFSFDGAVNISAFIQALKDSQSDGCTQYRFDVQHNLPEITVTNQRNRDSLTCSFQCDQSIDLELTDSIESLIQSLSSYSQRYIMVSAEQDSVDMIFS